MKQLDGEGEAADVAVTVQERPERKKTRIQTANEARILDAALAEFSVYGFRGVTLEQIAARAGMTKANLLYYFRRKQDLYLAVLTRTLKTWLQPLEDIDADGEPADEIRKYIRRKLQMSRDNPRESQLFANEILAGAPALMPVLEGPLKTLVDQKAEVISGWASTGRIADVDPHHLIFMIWATTQHYADFAAQVRALVDGRNDPILTARATLETIILNGLLPR